MSHVLLSIDIPEIYYSNLDSLNFNTDSDSIWIVASDSRIIKSVVAVLTNKCLKKKKKSLLTKSGNTEVVPKSAVLEGLVGLGFPLTPGIPD